MNSSIDFSYAYVHAIDPFAVQFWGNVGIRWYGLSYLLGFYCGYLIIRWMITRGLSPLPVALAGDFVFAVACGTVIGGRLGYCIFYSPGLLLRFSSEPPFWGVLALNEGGMASHGGIAGIAITCLYYARKHKLQAMHLMDLTTLGGSAGIFFGRIANFVNGELVGRPVSWAAPWAVKFPQDMFSWVGHSPELLLGLGKKAQLFGYSESDWTRVVGDSMYRGSAYAHVNAALEKILALIQQGNRELVDLVAPLLTARHPSQLYEALLEGLFLLSMLLLVWRRPRKPGVVTGCFFVLYSFVRCIGEQFRMPDAHIGFQALGLTRGQWLSLGLLAVGILVLVWSYRRSSPLFGGWANRAENSQNLRCSEKKVSKC